MLYFTLSLLSHRGFSVSTDNRIHVFKPVSVQAMWYVSVQEKNCIPFNNSFRFFFFLKHLSAVIPPPTPLFRSALQSLHKACEVARCHNYFPGSLFLTWVSYYQSRVSSDQAHINEWNAMQDVQSHRADSPVLFSDVYVQLLLQFFPL